MPVELKEMSDGRILDVRATGKIEAADYAQLVPMFKRDADKHGKLRLLFELHDFHGWTAGALWEDLKFEAKHFTDIERLAIVGDKKWEKGMALFCKPFTTAKVRYFHADQISAAREWLAIQQEHATHAAS